MLSLQSSKSKSRCVGCHCIRRTLLWWVRTAWARKVLMSQIQTVLSMFSSRVAR